MSEGHTYRGRETAYHILHRVLHGGAYSNLVVTSTFEKNETLTPEERKAAVFLVYGVLRNLRLLDEIFRSKAKKGKLTVTPPLLLVGRMAIFELMFLTKVPAYASASEYIKMARVRCSVPEAKFLNAVLRRVMPDDKNKVIAAAPTMEQKIAVEFSLPDWFVQSALKTYGRAECMKMFRAQNTGMPTYFRVNTTKVTVKELVEIFQTHRLEVDIAPNLQGCIYFKAGQNYFPAREFEAGWLTPQDFSAQIVARELAPQPGENILDLCCGRGTKTTHIAELMGAKGRIVACDIHEHKIKLLEGEKKRLGFESVIEGAAADITQNPDLGVFDRVLLDAPCSGSGTFRRRPELKQRVTPESLRSLIKLQRGLLCSSAAYVKPGGRLLYATCSVLPEENDDVVEYFLNDHHDFSIDRRAGAKGLIPCSRTPFGRVFLPHHTQSCAMAVTILKKKP